LKYLHDVKPANMMISDGNIKLTDFGASKEIALSESGTPNNLRTLIGTPIFMSPELLEGKSYTSKCDIWSFGITAIQIADGVAPFANCKNPMQALYEISFNKHPPTVLDPSNWSKEFNEFIAASLIKPPDQRLSAAQLLIHHFIVNNTKPDYAFSDEPIIKKYYNYIDNKQASNEPASTGMESEEIKIPDGDKAKSNGGGFHLGITTTELPEFDFDSLKGHGGVDDDDDDDDDNNNKKKEKKNKKSSPKKKKQQPAATPKKKR